MLKVHPKSPEANALTGDFLMLDKKVSEALPFYYTAALNERRDPRIWDNLLFVDNELRRFDSLEKHSGAAIELFPSQPRIYLYNGLANAELKNYNKAIQSLEDGLQFVVDDKALRTDFLRLLGDAYHSVQKYDKSDKSFEEALKLNSDNPYVLNNYAYYLSVRNQDLDRAEKLSKRANELSPGNRNYMDTYGWILYQQKKYAEAETWLSEAAKKGPKNPTILEHYGDVLFRLNRVKEALSEWNAAKQAGGSSPQLNRKISEKKLDEQ
jgi:tetratricopeptide (TPR) repeat protein